MAATATSASMTRQVYPVAAYWNLLSLDAPSVAVVWFLAFARAAGVPVGWRIPLALAAGTWIVYAADRILDARMVDGRAGGARKARLRERHWFHARHATAMGWSALPAAIFVAWVTATAMSRPMLLGFALLGVGTGVYFLAIHLYRGTRSAWKEPVVGTLFASAVSLPSLTQGRMSWPLLETAGAFAALATLNCLVIEKGEARRPLRTLQISLLLLGLAGVLLAVTAHSTVAQSRLQPMLPSCIGVSSGILLFIAGSARRMQTLTFRVACDAAMLTPLCWLLWPGHA